MGRARLRTSSSAAIAALLALVALLLATSSARAEAWGELKQFPIAEPKEIIESETSPIGVKFAAGSDGSYYVLTEMPASKEFLLERFHEGELQAKVKFKRPPEKEETSKVGTEGVNAILATDPKRNRVYVLLVYERREPDEKEEKEEEKSGKPVFPLDQEMPAAGSLYAFEYKNSELVSSATSKKAPAPRLTREELAGQAEHGRGEHPEEALPLLDPRGVAVEPATGDLAISGNQDEESNEKVEQGAAKQCRATVQFVTVGPEMEMSLGARYVDKENKINFGSTTGCGEKEEEEAINQAPASPVFAPDGTLLAFGEGEDPVTEQAGFIWQLAPADADEQHGELPMSPKELFVPEAIPTFAPQLKLEQPASVMSAVAESATEGTIYLSGYHTQGHPTPAVLHYARPTGGEPSITEIGWTAGAKENEHLGPEPCALHKADHEPIVLGGLAGSKRGLLAFTYYKERIGAPPGEEVPRAEAVEFGEGGSTTGCPTVPVSTPAQEYHGQPASKLPVSSTPLEVTSVLGKLEDGNLVEPAAGAKSVVWTVKFTGLHGETEEKEYKQSFEYTGLHEEAPGYGTVLALQLNIARVGAYEITDVVHTDDLADEVAQPAVADKLTVVEPRIVLHPGAPEPTTVFAHEQQAKLAVSAEEEPNIEALRIEKVVWEFGDGTSKEEQATSEHELKSPLATEHAFARCGAGATTKCKIKVTVEAKTASGKKKESTEFFITVKENKAEEQKRHEEEAEAAAKKLAEEAAARKHAEEEAAARKHAEEEAAAKKHAEEEAAAKKHAEELAKGGVAGYIASFAGSSLSVTSSGATSVTISCPSGGSCSGTLTLQTLGPVAASSKRHAPKKVLTLASGTFSLAGGKKAVTLHLSSAARALLGRSHGVLRTRLTILSRGSGGQQNGVAKHAVTLRLAAGKHHKQ